MEPLLKFHPFALQLHASPPDGFEFLVPRTSQQKMYAFGYHRRFVRYFMGSSDIFMPTGLIKAWLNRWHHTPEGTTLTYSTDQLVLRKEPWVIEVECASLLLGSHPKHLKRFRKILERSLSSPYCRKIICWSEVGNKSLISDLDCRGFQHKVEQINIAIPPRRFYEEYGDETRAKLLFVGSGTSTDGFDFKGGREVMAAFALLRQRYDNVELVVRSDVPADVLTQYQGLGGLRILEKIIPREELDREFQSADIFIAPFHHTSPLILLDAMSYGLPVVTIDAWANPQYVVHGETGLVARRSKKLSYYYADTHQPNSGTPGFIKAIRTPDPEVVTELASMVGLLIENPELRRKLGKAARHEVEAGKFSLAVMNRTLSRIFSEAVSAAE